MKKLIIIAAFAFVVSLATSSAFGRGEVRVRIDSQQDQQRQEQLRQDQQREQWQRDQWQRDQWRQEQDRHNQRHEQTLTYDFWLQMHSRDYDNRR